MLLRRCRPRRPPTSPRSIEATGEIPCAPRRDRRPAARESRLITQGYVGGEADAASGLIADGKRAAQLLHAVRQTTQTKMPGPRPIGGQPDAVVGHGGDDAPCIALHGDIPPRGARVPQGIDQALLYHPVNRERDAGAEFNGEFPAKRKSDRRGAPLPVAHQALWSA